MSPSASKWARRLALAPLLLAAACYPRYVVPRTPAGDACWGQCTDGERRCLRSDRDVDCTREKHQCFSRCPGVHARAGGPADSDLVHAPAPVPELQGEPCPDPTDLW